VARAKRIEEGLLHVQATLPSYVSEARELRELLEGKDGEEATTEEEK
jgi:hypothetical protein